MTTEKKPPTKKSKVSHKAGTRLTVAEKAEAIALWESGTATLETIAKRFGRSTMSFYRLFKAEGAVRGSKAKETEEKVKAAVAESVISTATEYAERVRQTKEDAYKYATMITKLNASILIAINRDGRNYGTGMNDLKTIKIAMETFKLAREERYSALGLSADDVGEERPLPDLMVQEITVEEIRQMAKANRVGSEDGDFDFEDLGDEGLLNDDDRVETE